MADLVTGGPCGLCGATETPRWWRADPPLCGAAALCHACHARARLALTRLAAAARGCPVAVVEALADRLEIGAAALPPPAALEPSATPAL